MAYAKLGQLPGSYNSKLKEVLSNFNMDIGHRLEVDDRDN
jgi:hypothetical protein